MRKTLLAACTTAVIASLSVSAVARISKDQSSEQHVRKASKGAHVAHRKPAPSASAASMSGGVQKGSASVYSPSFNGRRTASGRAFRQNENIAASKTLPLGSSARVTNLKTGQSAIVEVVDRGPYVRGRIIDLSPAAAEQLGMDRRGTAYVSVELVARP